MPHTAPNTAAGIRRPPLALLGIEPWRAAWEYFAHKRSTGAARDAADGHPVVLFPGLGSAGNALRPLRKYCKALGYDSIDWGRGFNTGPQGDVSAWLAELAAHTERLLAHRPQSATLLGWSLGGLYAREVAKLLGPRVRQVITIGTPFNADADHTNVGWVFRLLSGTPPAFDQQFSERLRTAPNVPTTSIYSRSDGVVAWQTCTHRDDAAHTEDVEVTSSHLGMGWNAAVLAVVADRLAQRPGQWQPYRATRAPA
jgi:hypothetical protein